MLLLYALLLAIGFFALIKGADLFVDGSSSLAGNFGIPKVIIGLTIVAMGTSAPELAVSTSAALQGSNEIALSNVVGSNIFNLLCVLGICAIIHPVPVEPVILKRDLPLSIIATILLLVLTSINALSSGQIFVMAMDDTAGNVSRITGIILLVIFITYILYLIADARKKIQEEERENYMPIWKCFILILIGLILIIGGGQAVVYSAKTLAKAFGMSETLIGLTIVAVGTSLPELVTSVVAAKKGEAGLAVGNVVGSNLFNILFILGVSSTIHPIAVNVASVYDMGILIIISILTALFSIKGKVINRLEGSIMVLIYIIDVIFAALR